MCKWKGRQILCVGGGWTDTVCVGIVHRYWGGGGVNIYCVEREEWYIGTVCRGSVNIYCVEREG